MNKFIVIDGLDGSGKDTQANLLADMYEKQYRGRDKEIDFEKLSETLPREILVVAEAMEKIMRKKAVDQ